MGLDPRPSIERPDSRQSGHGPRATRASSKLQPALLFGDVRSERSANSAVLLVAALKLCMHGVVTPASVRDNF